MKGKVLIVDDEDNILEIMKTWLSDIGYHCMTANNYEDAIRKIDDNPLDIIITDVCLGEDSGLDIVKYVNELEERIQIIVITGFAEVEEAVEAMKNGAYDYIKKPFHKDRILTSVENCFERQMLINENKIFKKKLQDEYNFQNIIGASKPMLRVFDIIKRIADSSQSTVLIQGDSGTGKELVAKAIHFNSTRKDMPFVEINCNTLSDTLFESELFGHVKGAFTDAKNSKKGILDVADGGTLFLDEIGDLKPSFQVKLLKVLEEKKFRRVGGVEDINVDIRLIVATNRDLKKEVEKGNFREDLYYRLSVIPIELPLLKDRGEDIILIAQFYIDKFNAEFNRNVKGLSQKGKWVLKNYSWPGNIRELKNVIERAVLLERKEFIDLNFFKKESIINDKIVSEEDDGIPSLEKVEIEHIKKVLEFTQGKKKKASELLGISRRTLYQKIKEFHIDVNKD